MTLYKYFSVEIYFKNNSLTKIKTFFKTYRNVGYVGPRVLNLAQRKKIWNLPQSPLRGTFKLVKIVYARVQHHTATDLSSSSLVIRQYEHLFFFFMLTRCFLTFHLSKLFYICSKISTHLFNIIIQCFAHMYRCSLRYCVDFYHNNEW